MMQKSRMILWFLLAAIFSAAAVTPLSAASRGISVTTKQGKPVYLYKDYHALVVGVSEYESWPDLPNAVRDAREVAAELKKSGFLVELIVNPDSKQLKSAMSTLAYKKGRESDRAVLFYFAGHGETTTLADGTELGYIIPRDCPLKRADPMGFDEKALSMNQVETCSMKVASKHVLMVFDSCFSGSLFNMTRAAPTDISEKSASPVRQYITAGAAGEQVPDKSIFKTVFLDGIKGEADLNSDGYVTGSELGMHLQDKVVNYTRGCQHPQYGKINNPRLDKGDFIFMLASSGATVETPSASKEKAYLNVTANTQGAQVLIDGRSAGNAPLSGIELAPGNHTVRVEKAGYVAYSKQVKLSSGRSISLQAFLSPQAPETGRLFLETNPKGAHVRILNINPVYYEGMELEPGRYHVEVSASGYETSTQWVSLVAGEDKYLSMGLKEKAVAVQGGRLTEITDTHQTAASGNRITVES
ncbi:MAG: PEGA domain-containing protein, partial [Deltaproteobacteria bacterium]|nr:PEGA domain-containing protein [Deltaproteobacteria bacterium]